MNELMRILIVDDHPLIRSGIKGVLEQESDMVVVGEANNGSKAVEMAEQLKPHVILMDYNLPGKSGIEAIKEILAQNPAIRILILSNYSDEKIIFSALEAGAMGYILKVDSVEKIVSALREALKGNPTLSTQAERGLLSYLQGKRTNQPYTKPLTNQEKTVLIMMAEGKTNADIAAHLYISEGTVRSHVSHIISKLKLQNRAQAIIYAVKDGLVKLEHDAK